MSTKTLYDILDDSIVMAGDDGADALVALELDDKPALVLYIGDGNGNYEEDTREDIGDDSDLETLVTRAEDLLDERLEAQG